MDTTVLSLDTSSSSTGWALFRNGIYQSSGVIDLKHIKDSPTRMRCMVSELHNLLDDKSNITIAIETPVVVRNPHTQRMLTMIFGAVYSTCIRNGFDFQELRPTEWRKLIDPGKKPRKREELKEWSKQKVKELFGIENVNDDIADAILIGEAYCRKMK